MPEALCWGEDGLRAFPGVGGPLPPPPSIPVLAQGLNERPQSQTTNASVNKQSMSLKYETVGTGASQERQGGGTYPKGCKTG